MTERRWPGRDEVRETFACPHCGSEQGEACIGVRGKTRASNHRERVDEYVMMLEAAAGPPLARPMTKRDARAERTARRMAVLHDDNDDDPQPPREPAIEGDLARTFRDPGGRFDESRLWECPNAG